MDMFRKKMKKIQKGNGSINYEVKKTCVGAFSDRIGLPPAVTGWAASCDGGP